MLCSDKRPGPDLSLAVAGLALFDEIEELFGEEAGIRRKGALVVHADSGGWASEQARLAGLQAAGVSCSLLSADEVREAEPSLAVRCSGRRGFRTICSARRGRLLGGSLGRPRPRRDVMAGREVTRSC